MYLLTCYRTLNVQWRTFFAQFCLYQRRLKSHRHQFIAGHWKGKEEEWESWRTEEDETEEVAEIKAVHFEESMKFACRSILKWCRHSQVPSLGSNQGDLALSSVSQIDLNLQLETFKQTIQTLLDDDLYSQSIQTFSFPIHFTLLHMWEIFKDLLNARQRTCWQVIELIVISGQTKIFSDLCYYLSLNYEV